MLRHLHQTSAVLFYLIGSALFVSYILLRNGIGGEWPLLMLMKADLPMLAAAMLYGGLSVYLSIDPETKGSHALGWIVAVPLALAFVFFAILNFLY
jgi:hypothetical protein